MTEKATETLADRLPYFDFDKETEAIWLKDGSATLSLKITPKDCQSLTDAELETLRHGLTPILGRLPEGSVLQALLLRERSSASSDEAYQCWKKSHAPKAQPQDSPRSALFSSRNELLASKLTDGLVFQTRCYITLRVLSDIKLRPGKTLGSLSFLAFPFSIKSKEPRRGRPEILRDLSAGVEGLRAGLTTLGFEVSPVSREERTRIIYEWLNPERAQSLPAPQGTEHTLSDRLALTDLIEDRRGLSLGRTGMEIATLKTLPEITIPAVMGTLASAPQPFSLIFTIYVLPQTQERDRLLRKQRLTQGMATGNAVRNLIAEAQLRDVEDTLNALISSGEKIFGVSAQLVGLRESHR